MDANSTPQSFDFVTLAQFSEFVSSIQFQLTLMAESLRTFIQAAQAIPVVNSSLAVFPAGGRQTQYKKRKSAPQQTAPQHKKRRSALSRRLPAKETADCSSADCSKPKNPALPAFSMSLPDILTVIQTRPFFYRPLPFRSVPAQRNQTWFCLYHNGHGHQTVHCRDLKDFLEGLHQYGFLDEFLVPTPRQPRNDPQSSQQPRTLSRGGLLTRYIH